MGLTSAEGSPGLIGLAPLASTVLDITPSEDAEEETSHFQLVSRIQETIQDELTRIEEQNPSEEQAYTEQDGRIGDARVIMSDRGAGHPNCCPKTGKVESTSNFGTAVGTAGVITGKWMYEVTIVTAGIQQLGWATLQCQFTSEEGVGDTQYSYAYDGKRRRKWNQRANEYGERWAPGDVVGVCIDLEACEVSFALNGRKLGVAFEEIRVFEPQLAYFPAVSLSEGEAAYVNLGSAPLRFPIDDFKPMQAPPPASRSLQCNWLLEKMSLLCSETPQDTPTTPPLATLAPSASLLPSSPTKAPAAETSRVATSSRKAPPIAAERVLLGGCLADSLSPFLSDPYQLNACFVPWMLGLQSQDTLASMPLTGSDIGARRLRSTPLAAAISLLEAVLEDWELRRALHTATLALGLCALGATVTSGSGSLGPVATVATIFSSEGPATTALLGWDDLKDHLERLLVIRRPCDADMATAIPNAIAADGTRNEEAFAAATDKLRTRVEAIQRMHVALLRPLLFYKPTNMKCLPSHARVHPGSRTAFHAFVHCLVRSNVGVLRQVPPAGISNNSTLSNLFFVVLWLLGPSMNSSRLSAIPSSPMSLATSGASRDSSPHTKPQQAPPSMLTPPLPDPGTGSAPQLTPLPAPAHFAASVPSSTLSSVNASPTLSSPLADASTPLADASLTPLADGAAGADHGPHAVNLTAVSTRRGSRRAEGGSRGGKRGHAGSRRDESSFWNFPTAKLFVPDKLPMDNNREAYLGLNRVGGILSEATRSKPQQGEPRYTDMWDISDALQEAGVGAHNMHGDTPVRHMRNEAHYLVDLAVLLYTMGLQITYQRVSAQVRTVQDLNARLGKLSATIAAASADSARASSIARLQENKSKLLEDLATESRTLEWHQAVSVHGGWKSLAISQLSLYLAALLRRIQGASPNIWAHVPEMYVECAVCSFHALQRTQTEALMPTTVHVAALLSRLLGDARLVSPNMRDVVLQSVTNLLSSPGTLAAIADDDEVMDLLLPGLMERYTQDHWTSLSPTFLRAIGRDTPPWDDGTAAAAGAASTPPPAAVAAVRARIARLARGRHPAAVRFVQNLFSALDWAVTEATVCLRNGAAATAAGRPTGFSSSQRRRLLVFFSIAVTCAQLMAFLVSDVPSLFMQGPPVLADRLAEMLAFLIVHAPVDASSDEYAALVASAGSVDRANNPFLHPLALARPLVAMLGSLWTRERGTKPAVAEDATTPATDADTIPEAEEEDALNLDAGAADTAGAGTSNAAVSGDAGDGGPGSGAAEAPSVEVATPTDEAGGAAAAGELAAGSSSSPAATADSEVVDAPATPAQEATDSTSPAAAATSASAISDAALPSGTKGVVSSTSLPVETSAAGPAAEAPGGPEFTIEQSIVDRLCRMPAACPNEHLDQLRSAVLNADDLPEGSTEGNEQLRDHCRAVAEMVEEFVSRRARGDLMEADVPEDFMDPITMACMVDPVRLPDSRIIIDRSTIERHLEESSVDPYSRAPLEADALEPMHDLKKQIEEWRKALAAKPVKEASTSLDGGGACVGGASALCSATGAEGGSVEAPPQPPSAAASRHGIVSHVPESWDVDSGPDDGEGA